ncbi:hypothetical protein HOI18_05070 [Candidatus Uhrbacteria bacterium]|jgi:hypothetical protein|nr:hypothetical protein [Candidatus Uhrbacteria bacterium]
MEVHRLITWGANRPSRDMLRTALDNYIGSDESDVCIGSTHWAEDNSDGVTALYGTPSHPLKTTGGQRSELASVRMFKTLWNNEFASITVITSQADPLTEAVADGFVKFCLATWGGELMRG